MSKTIHKKTILIMAGGTEFDIVLGHKRVFHAAF
jgi:hypothetical protein